MRASDCMTNWLTDSPMFSEIWGTILFFFYGVCSLSDKYSIFRILLIKGVKAHASGQNVCENKYEFENQRCKPTL